MPRGRSPGYQLQRETILARAGELFAKNGYTATSMNEVAEACGVSKPSLYHYVRDKHQLLAEIAEAHIARLLALIAEVDAALPAPEQRLRRLIDAFLAAYAGAQAEHRVLTEDVRFLAPAEKKRVLGGQRRVVAAFAEAIVAIRPELAAAGLQKPLAMLLFGMMNWMFTWLQPTGELSHADLAPVVADLFFGGVGAVRAPAPRIPPRHHGDSPCPLQDIPSSPPASRRRPRSPTSRTPTSPSA
ncbi:MAG: TetR/AcrR family transcriptional regulator [Caldimonas sp.]